MKAKNDQMVGPAVVFATAEAEQRIAAEMRAKFDEAAQYAIAQGGMAVQLGEDLAQVEREIKDLERQLNERHVMASEKSGDKRQAELNARHCHDVAKGYADMLAAAGVQIPPYGGELSHNPDGALDRLDAAHEEHNRSGVHS